MYLSSKLFVLLSVVVYFKQKTAYDMRISDWSSDVCSSDLLPVGVLRPGPVAIDTETMGLNPLRDRLCLVQISDGSGDEHLVRFKIGRASCRERVCQYG